MTKKIISTSTFIFLAVLVMVIESSGNVQKAAAAETATGGTITVQSLPSGARFELRGPQNIRKTGITPATFTNMPPYYYAVHYSKVEDCQLPRPQQRPLEVGSSVTFYVDFLCASEVVAPVETLPATKPEEREGQINVRVWNTFHQTEAVPGSSVVVTVGVRNISRKTIHHLSLTQSFDPNQVSMPVVLPRGGKLGDKQITWEIPEIYAGQSWMAVFPVTVNETFESGEKIELIAHVTGKEIRSPRGELLSEVAVVGIASMPQSGENTAKGIGLLITAAALVLAFSIRRQSYRVRTV